MGKNNNGINFTATERLKISAAKLHFFWSIKYKLQTRKKIITDSKCRLPVSSMIINGFKAYKKI